MYIIILFLQLCLANSLYLTLQQSKSIINLIKNPLLTDSQRNKINYVLFKAYDIFAKKKALEFKNIHTHKCKDISTQELILYSRVGLYNAIKKYNGSTSFINYSSIYISSELYKLLTDRYALSILPKSYRKKNKMLMTEEERIKYKNLLDIYLVSYDEIWKFDKKLEFNKYQNTISSYENKNFLFEQWQQLNNKLDPFSKKIFQYKYDVEFNKIRSNKQISELMCCSEETIRKKILWITNNL